MSVSGDQDVIHEPGQAATMVERVTEFLGPDLHDLCDAAEAAISDGGGFGWLKPPPRHVMETYWKGVLLVPERDLFVARLDRTVAGSAQLVGFRDTQEEENEGVDLHTLLSGPATRS